MEKKKIQPDDWLAKLKALRHQANSALKSAAASPKFGSRFAWGSLAVLLTTTLVWSLLGAAVQSGNADQLVDPYLFNNSQTLHGVSLPGAHTMLFKWPLFWLISAVGASGASFALVTVGLVLITVGVLALILYKIDKRPLVFGTLCLALASTLLLIPTQPYAGALLPVNMAMVATRNLEYVLYIGSLYLITRSSRVLSWRFGSATVLLALLIASDKLFASLSLGAALLMLMVNALNRSWNLTGIAARWVVSSLAAAAGAIGALALVNRSHFVHIIGQASANPYGLVHNLHQAAQGAFFSLLSLLTNFGANPGYDTTTIKTLPHFARLHLLSVGGPAYVINGLVLLAGLFALAKLVWPTLLPAKKPNASQPLASSLGLMLAGSGIVSFVIFIFTRHFYPVDARYLTICLFAIFTAMAIYTRTKTWQANGLLTAAAVLGVAIILGLVNSFSSYHSEKSALAETNRRNATVASALAQHPVNTLVGDYWRVLPIKLASRNKQAVTPLSNCTQFRDVLSSSTWQLDLKTHSFAYLLSLDRSLTDYPSCSLDQIISAYGRPNASALIAGKINDPKEVLLFYDHGAHLSSPIAAAKTTSTVLPIDLADMPYTSCAGPTIVNIVAHQDDDLLFMNPDLLHDINAGHCIRTIYATAGDAGGSQFYWLNREAGSEAAYSKMLDAGNNIWVKRIVKLSDHQYVTVANLRGGPKVSLIFMHLPDGNQGGNGFKSSGYQSLASLWGYHIKTIESEDGQSSYSYKDLVDALASFMHIYAPAEIRTQANLQSRFYPDHSDHMAVSRFTKLAYTQYETQQFDNKVVVPIKYYLGYPVHVLAANVSGTDFQQKEAAWLEYAKFDGDVCQTVAACDKSPTYGSYLRRQYQTPG